MGKAKKKRGSARANPTGAEVMGGEEEEMVPRSELQILDHIVQQLQSVNPEDKVCGCHSLGTLTDAASIKQVVLEQKMVRVVGPLLLDPDEMVRLAAAGALRNVSALDPDTAEELVAQDVMTPLEQCLARLQGAGQPLTDQNLELLTECIHLLWNLVEASGTAFRLFNSGSHQLVEFVLSLLQLPEQQQSPQQQQLKQQQLVLGVLNLLAAACDQTQNKLTAEKVLSQRQVLERLLVSGPTPSIRISCALLLSTVLEDSLLEATLFNKIMETLSCTLKPDVRTELCSLSSTAPVSEEMEVEGGDVDHKFKDCEEILQSQQTALEILANLCSLGEDGDNWEDGDSEEDEEGEMEEEEAMNGEVSDPTSAPPLLVEAVTTLGLVPTVLEKANPLPENVAEILRGSRQGKKLVNAYENIRVRTFLCLSNLTECLSLDDLGGPVALFSTWTSLGAIVVQSTDEKLLESASSCMRSVTSKLCTTEGCKVMNLTQNELQAMVLVGQTSQVAEVRMNMVHIIGDIAIMLSKSLHVAASADIFRVLIGWLLDGGCKDSDLRVVAESLDKLFDAFSEDDTDTVFFQMGLLPKLRSLLSSLKPKLAAGKRALSAEELGPVKQAKLNLTRFIKYKEKRPNKT